MTHILWCGGSHLAFAKESILNYFNQGQNSFLITAGPVLARWAMKGGRYEIKSTESSETLFRQSINNAYPEESIDVSNYSTIIFVGQWLVPRQLFRPKTLLSPGTIDAICTEDNILNPSTGPLNEPLIIFPKLAENRSKIILLPDPFPVKNYKTSNGFFWQIPHIALDRYYAQVRHYCDRKGVILIDQPASTLSAAYATHKKFSHQAENGRIDHHLSRSFWDIYIKTLKNQIKTI